MSNLQQTCKLAITGKININRQDTINEILHKLAIVMAGAMAGGD